MCLSEGVLLHARRILESFFSILFILLCLGMGSSNLVPVCIVLCETRVKHVCMHVENMLIQQALLLLAYGGW